METPERISIQPEVGMYAAFARLNYKPWFALAEFVDNSIQSYLHNRAGLDSRLRVDIEIDRDVIRIHDNAAGITWADFPRAFTPAKPPPDRGGLSEFGLGMKAAACWFAKEWSVRTKVVGDPFERSVVFDIPTIVGSNLRDLAVIAVPVNRDSHYTVVELRSLRVTPKGRTLEKIKMHLTSIYRKFLAEGTVQIRVRYPGGGEHILDYEPPAILEEQFHESPGVPVGPTRLWRKEFTIDLGADRTVSGWAGVLKKGSLHYAGFSVFRRNRLIQGSYDETYRPSELFKAGNSYAHQRLVGEMNCKGFQVSHTKDGIDWGGHEEAILAEVEALLNSDDLPLLQQINNYRHRFTSRELPASFGTSAIQHAGEDLVRSGPPIIARNLPATPSYAVSEATLGGTGHPSGFAPPPPVVEPVPTAVEAIQPLRLTYEFEIPDHAERWRVALEVLRQGGGDWYSPTSSPVVVEDRQGLRDIAIRLNLDHPFSEQFISADEGVMATVVRVLTAMAIAESVARESGGSPAAVMSCFRRTFNELLRDVLSQPADRQRGTA